MSSYKVSEPSALKYLKANGAIVDENGNVVKDASDYWKKVYEQAEPKVAKYLHADGTIDENPSGSGGGGGLPDTVYFYGVIENEYGYAGYCSMVSSEEITGVGTYDVYFYPNAVLSGGPLARAEATDKISITIDEVIEGSCGYSLGRFTYNDSTYYLCLGKE